MHVQELFGGVALGLPNDTLVGGATGPLSFDGSFRRGWINWRRNVPGPYLHPVGFFLYVDMTGTDSKEWKLLKVCDVLFPSTMRVNVQRATDRVQPPSV